jgi:6-pyruvoyltetrahydropterin/6-carboxytetrahydropterin synthase
MKEELPCWRLITAERYHDISCGHRVTGHESKCRFLHGHNYRFRFTITGNLDSLGRIIDFGVIKTILCEWLEIHYDHKFLIWKNDPLMLQLNELHPESLVITDFNPTAENIAKNFVEEIAPVLLNGTNTELIKLTIEETRKCHASYEVRR